LSPETLKLCYAVLVHRDQSRNNKTTIVSRPKSCIIKATEEKKRKL